MATGTPSLMMRPAAMAIDCRPDEQKRLIVVPEVVTGQPAQMAARRPIFMPVAPSGAPQPMMTSSTSPGSMPARAMACLIAWPAMAAPCVLLKPPRPALARPVRAVETMTASLDMDGLPKGLAGFSIARLDGEAGRRRLPPFGMVPAKLSRTINGQEVRSKRNLGHFP